MSDASIYFGNVRTQIEPLLAARAERVLELQDGLLRPRAA